MSSEIRSILEPTGPQSEVVKHCRDVRIYHQLMPTRRIIADLNGRAKYVQDHGAFLLVGLFDATGAIRLEFYSASFSKEEWKEVKKIRKLDRIHALGEVTKKNESLTVTVDHCEIFLSKTLAGNELDELGVGMISTQFLLARIRLRGAEYFRNLGYEEFEPALISAGHEESTIKSLGVVFSGFGSNATLFASPASQMLEAVLVAPSPKVFCVSRCFSDAIRDGYTSAESLILCVRELNVEVENLCRTAENGIKHIFNHFTTRPEELESDNTWLSHNAWSIKKYDSTSFVEKLNSPEIQLFPPGTDPSAKNSIFRICWPPRATIAEGHVEYLDESNKISLGGFTLHLERMVPLLKDVVLRRLRHI